MATMKTATSGPRTADGASGEMSAELSRLDEELRAFVKERPITALLGAVAAGYVIGRILRRV